MDLSTVETALTRDDHPAALAAALAAYRAQPSSLLAELVDALSARVPAPKLAQARGEDAKRAFHRAFLALARGGGPEALPALLAGLTRQLEVHDVSILVREFARKRHRVFLERLAALDRFLPDPRAAAPLLELAARAPFEAIDEAAAAAVYGPLVAALVRAGDVRVPARLEALAARPGWRTKTLRAYLAQALAGAARVLAAAERPLSPPDSAAVERLLAELGAPRAPVSPRATDGPQSPEQVLAEVLARPDDRELRLVLGDLLLERGDPRGELIALQAKDARGEASLKERSRIQGLIRKHQRDWLGELSLALCNVRFELGFPVAAEVRQGAAAEDDVWARAAEDPGLATLRELRQGQASEELYARFVTSPALRRLEDVDLPSRRLLTTVCERGEPWSFRRLRLRRYARGALDLIAASPSLPWLRELDVRASLDELARLEAELRGHPLLGQLARVTLEPHGYYHEEPLAAWLSSVRALAPLPSLALRKVTATVAGPRGELALEVWAEGAWGLPAYLALVPPPIASLTVHSEGDPAAPLREPGETRRVLAALRPAKVLLPEAWRAQLG